MKSIEALYERIGEYPWRSETDLADFDALVDAVRYEMREMKSEELTCAFCGKPRSEVEYLVQSTTGQCICNDCALTAIHLIMQNQFKCPSGKELEQVSVPEDKLARHMVNMSGMTQSDISEKMGKSRGYVLALTSRGSSPSAANLTKLAKACGYKLTLEGYGESIEILPREGE